MSDDALRAARQDVTQALFDKLRAERDKNVVALVKARARLKATCRDYNALICAASTDERRAHRQDVVTV